MDMAIIILLIVLALLVVLNILMLYRLSQKEPKDNVEKLQEYIDSENRDLRMELSSIVQLSVKNMADILNESQKASASVQSEKLMLMEKRLNSYSLENGQQLNNIRETMEKRLELIRNDNNRRLDSMQNIVDEKLQKTLEEKMSRSFSLVNERLEQVYKGLGEMQSIASGVGDLKKVLSNVKTRGILGEIQLGSILKEILAPEQYDENVVTKKGSRNPVEFAVKLPAEDNSFIYLPIDSKFPGDTYANLQNAVDNGNKEEIDSAAKKLISAIKSEAKDIHDKYISVPDTTEFAIMFLPFEGLYAEVVSRGLVEILQRDYKINVAGPSTMAALLNSLQMGFKTLAVQKRSAEVWQILGEVKGEFDKFADILSLTQQRLEQANNELDKLVGVRTRQIQKKLSDVTKLENTTLLEK